MIPFKLGSTQLNIPSSWDEITTEQVVEFKHMKNKMDLCEILAILTGVDYKLIAAAEVSQLALNQISLAVKWFRNKIDFLSLEMPTFLEFGETKIKVKQDLGTKVMAQVSQMNQQVYPLINFKKQQDESYAIESAEPEAVALTLAIVFQPMYTGKPFNPETLDEFLEVCKKVPATKAFPVANFFLRKYLGLEDSINRSDMNQRQKKLKRASNS
jgi:hypothetical protein